MTPKLVPNSYCGPDVSLSFPQLLPQALGQGGHSILGGRVEMSISIFNHTMPTNAATANV